MISKVQVNGAETGLLIESSTPSVEQGFRC